MVTRRVVRISPEEKAAATVYGNRHKNNNLLQNNNNERGDEKKSLNMADDGDIDRFGGNLHVDVSHCPSLPPLPPLESEAVEEESMEITRQDNDADDNNKKRPRYLENADRGVKKKRKKLETKKPLDVSDVPEQPLIRSKRKSKSSQYKGVYFHKLINKWVAHIWIDGKNHKIGSYDDEEEAAKDYARAVFKVNNVAHPALKSKEGNCERRGRKRKNLIDLSDVPMQLPIKSGTKGSSSQYKGVSFDKANNKWEARIRIDGKQHKIGRFDDEEEAAIDFARAVFKYKGAHASADSEKSNQKTIDLTDVPKQLPIKSEKMGSSSQYKGVTFFKACKKWRSKIYIDGEPHVIGYYDNEEEAAVDYARAIFKYKGGHHQRKKLIDLTGIPAQPPIKSDKKGLSSQYKGVCFDKSKDKWVAKIKMDGKQRTIGYYVDEEKAGIDYARAVFKYKGENAKGSSRRHKKLIDLTGIPVQLPIKSYKKGSSSRYKGVTFNKANNKWVAKMKIDGKSHAIGYYDDEEKAAIDYARAVFKYKAGGGESSSGQRKKYIDLDGVPTQPPITSEKKGTSSQYKGVFFDKRVKKWISSIRIDGKNRNIGYYDDEEKAGIDYARAVFKYNAGNAEGSNQRVEKFIDLTDVPSQLPIKSDKKGSSSQYKGVSFKKNMKKWQACIKIDGKVHSIGYYDDEEVAATNYARAVFKYKAGGGESSSGQRKKYIDLTGVPTQPPITSEKKGSSSQYKGVFFDRRAKKWISSIRIDGKNRNIGYYDDEEKAGIDYARAVFKYNAGNAEGSSQRVEKFIDLTDVPSQLPIKSDKKGTSSQHKGVFFDKVRKKWLAKIMIDGQLRHIGYYDDEEKAGIDYARAVFKYKEGSDEGSSRRQKKLIDLTGIPAQLPIKSEKKGTSSQYKGVFFDKSNNKWWAQINVDGKQRKIGHYDNEEEAAIDYARAVFKYKGAETEGSSQRGEKFIDLTDVPKQLPIKSEKKGKSSQYKGVFFEKVKKKWIASIRIDGKLHYIGYYDDEEKAGIDYARAVFKYKAGNARGNNERQGEKSIGSTDVPTLPPISTV